MKTHRKLTRRRFFQLSSVAAAAAALGTERLLAAPETGFTIPLSDDGWRMWPDTEAAWQDDALYLPDEVDLARLPIHPPTSGWQALNAQQGIPVTLPASVEQYYWGRFGARPYTKNEYEYAEIDQKLINGAYRGVSWFWRSFELPAPSHGRQVTLHIRGYRQRVEVFVNLQLAGYDMIAETSYECDITRLLRPDANTLALPPRPRPQAAAGCPIRPPVSAPGCRPWSSPPAPLAQGQTYPRSGRPRRPGRLTVQSDRAWALTRPCRRSCAYSSAPRCSRLPRLARKHPECTGSRTK